MVKERGLVTERLPIRIPNQVTPAEVPLGKGPYPKIVFTPEHSLCAAHCSCA